MTDYSRNHNANAGNARMLGYPLCLHLRANPNQPTVILKDNDQGTVEALCNDCAVGMGEPPADEMFRCDDCKECVGSDDGSEWEPWDYDSSYNDEKYFICDNCLHEDKHQERVARDNRNRLDHTDTYMGDEEYPD